MKTPQFQLLATTFLCTACSGVGLFSIASPMMTDTFSKFSPGVVSASFASTFVLLMSAGNVGGRLGWALFFDKFGPKPTFSIFTVGSVPLYLALPFCVSSAVTTGTAAPVYGFSAASVLAISCMGGMYSLLPAYEAKIFGPKYVGAIHGRMMLASSGAAMVGGPLAIGLRNHSERKALDSLLEQVDPVQFQETFQHPLSQANELIESKTLTINSLMHIMPEGVADPSPFVYHNTMYTMAGLLFAASVAHSLIKPVDRKYFTREEKPVYKKVEPTPNNE